MTDELCNRTSDTLIAKPERQTFVANNITIEERSYVIYEACHYIIEVPDYVYMDGAYIEITIDSLDKANLYIYEGTGRHNATTFIEGNATSTVGAPYRIPASSKAILVMQTIENGLAGSGSFSFQVYGTEYPFWEKAFLGEDTWKWNAALIMALLVPFLLLVLIIVCFVRCCSSPSESKTHKSKVASLDPEKEKPEVVPPKKSENQIDFSEDEESSVQSKGEIEMKRMESESEQDSEIPKTAIDYGDSSINPVGN